MKTINELTVKVTYNVTLSDVEVSDEVYDALMEISEEGGKAPDRNDPDNDLTIGSDWLADNINEDDAHDWSHEIYEIN